MKNYIAELIGTFLLVFCGTGAGIINEQTGGAITQAGVAVVWALIVMYLIFSVGKTSGAHVNPAISIAFTITGRFPKAKLAGYIISQIIGAIIGSFVLSFLFPRSDLLGSTVPKGGIIEVFVLELFLTFALMLPILFIAHGSKETGKYAGPIVGSIVGLEAFFAGPISGASMNPARSIGPALVSGHMDTLWIYIIAPIAGAALAVPVWKFSRFLKAKALNARHQQQS